MKKLLKSKTALTLFLLVWVIPATVLALAYWKDAHHNPQFITTQTAAQTGQAFPGAHLSYNGAGTWSIPDQAPPGAYALAAGKGIYGCSWTQLTHNDERPKSEITTGTLNPGGFTTITINSKAAYVRFIGDCSWQKVTS